MRTINKMLVLGALGLSMAPLSVSLAQPAAGAPGLAENPPNRGQRGARRAKGQAGQLNERQKQRLEERALAEAEAIAGQPLSDEQKAAVRESLAAREAAVREAREKYVAEMAATLKVEPDEVRLKLRAAQAAGRRGGGANADGVAARGGGRRNRAGRRNRGAAPAAGAVQAPVEGGGAR